MKKLKLQKLSALRKKAQTNNRANAKNQKLLERVQRTLTVPVRQVMDTKKLEPTPVDQTLAPLVVRSASSDIAFMFPTEDGK